MEQGLKITTAVANHAEKAKAIVEANITTVELETLTAMRKVSGLMIAPLRHLHGNQRDSQQQVSPHLRTMKTLIARGSPVLKVMAHGVGLRLVFVEAESSTATKIVSGFQNVMGQSLLVAHKL
mmetsp:Transcript_1740/g.2782  ORF Transcript_1740/g.2782 Transcript_1740/m.2782 type:complete len:123 (-) Transcript_1740:1521-1889(-)